MPFAWILQVAVRAQAAFRICVFKRPFVSVFDPANYPQVSVILEFLYGQAELQATESIEQRA